MDKKKLDEEPRADISEMCNQTEFKEKRFEIFDLEKYGFQYNNMEHWTDLK